MNSFKKYHKIYNLNKNNNLNENFIISEKIHGANFSMEGNIKDDNISFFRRNGIIKKDEDFYNFYKIKDKLIESCLLFKKYLIKNSMIKNKFKIFGELFGGGYPSVKTDTRPIQHGIWYSPNIEFMVFDIYVDDSYIGFIDNINILNKCGFEIVPILNFNCSFNDVLNMNIKLNSLIPNILNHPKLENNIMEGIVIKVDPPKYNNRQKRLIFKLKNDQFLEKRIKNNNIKNSKLNEESQKTLDTLLMYLCLTRLNNVISKIENTNNYRKIIGLFIKDAWDDFKNDGNEINYGNNQNEIKNQKTIVNKLIFIEAEKIYSINKKIQYE